MEIRCVGAKIRLLTVSSTGSCTSRSTGVLEATTQSPGAVTAKRKEAFRSGCSKVGKTRRQSAGSYWVYR